MNTPDLPQAEYWFYRVASELTIALLHQVNNELTGVIFTAEDIEQEVSESIDPKEKFSVLHGSVQKVIQLIQETVNVNVTQQEMLPNPRFLPDLIRAEIPILRLLIPKSVGITFSEASGIQQDVLIPENELRILLAAVGLILRPAPSRSRNCEFSLRIETEPSSSTDGLVALRFTPDYLRRDSAAPTAEEEICKHPDLSALEHRLKRMGGTLDFPVPHNRPDQLALRMFLPVATG